MICQKKNIEFAAALIVITLLVSLVLFFVPSHANTTIEQNGSIYEANKNNPGDAVDLNVILSHDKPTLLFIHSEHCGPCKRIAPSIKKLAQLKPDIKVVELMLDGKAEKDIGWESAAAKQFKIHSVPAYVVYDSTGKEEKSGLKAKEQVKTWLKEVGLLTDK